MVKKTHVGTRKNVDGVVRKDTFERKAGSKFRQKVGFIQANAKPVSLNIGESSCPSTIFPF